MGVLEGVLGRRLPVHALQSPMRVDAILISQADEVLELCERAGDRAQSPVLNILN
jgi:hypothetical protein